MTGKVEIINIALARLGESPIQSLSEGTVPANMAKVFYDPARRATLRDYTWNFSIVAARLARLSEKVIDFRFAYSLPADCLRVIRLRRSEEPDFEGNGARFTVRGGVLCTDAEEAILEYVSDVEDTSLFDDKFIEALSYKLASELAMPVKGSSELMANYMNVYATKVTQAAAHSAGEEREDLSDNPYVEARIYGDR